MTIGVYKHYHKLKVVYYKKNEYFTLKLLIGHSFQDFMHRSMTLLLAYLNKRLQLDFSPQQVVNNGAHVIVCGETYCYLNLSWGHGTVH